MVPQSYFDLSPKSNFIGHLRLSGHMLSNLQKDFQWIKVNYSFDPILFLLFQKSKFLWEYYLLFCPSFKNV